MPRRQIFHITDEQGEPFLEPVDVDAGKARHRETELLSKAPRAYPTVGPVHAHSAPRKRLSTGPVVVRAGGLAAALVAAVAVVTTGSEDGPVRGAPREAKRTNDGGRGGSAVSSRPRRVEPRRWARPRRSRGTDGGPVAGSRVRQTPRSAAAPAPSRPETRQPVPPPAPRLPEFL